MMTTYYEKDREFQKIFNNEQEDSSDRRPKKHGGRIVATAALLAAGMFGQSQANNSAETIQPTNAPIEMEQTDKEKAAAIDKFNLFNKEGQAQADSNIALIINDRVVLNPLFLSVGAETGRPDTMFLVDQGEGLRAYRSDEVDIYYREEPRKGGGNDSIMTGSYVFTISEEGPHFQNLRKSYLASWMLSEEGDPLQVIRDKGFMIPETTNGTLSNAPTTKVEIHTARTIDSEREHPIDS